MASEQKMVTISTIPLTKLSIIMNNFVANTITHLNKLSVKGDEKLAEFDKKLNDLDVMTTLLEAKLNSLPEKITSTYPPLPEVGLDDIIPVIVQNPPPSQVDEKPPEQPDQPSQDNNNNQNETQAQTEGEEQKQEEAAQELSPQEELDQFLDEHVHLRNTCKLLKMKIPYAQVEQKAGIQGLDIEELKVLYELVKKVDPNIK